MDWKTVLLITEVTVQHTNLKFSEESKLCSGSQESIYTHKCGSQNKCFSSKKDRKGVCAQIFK